MRDNSLWDETANEPVLPVPYDLPILAQEHMDRLHLGYYDVADVLQCAIELLDAGDTTEARNALTGALESIREEFRRN